jgi:transcriptional regulator with XRE-family HTH domain
LTTLPIFRNLVNMSDAMATESTMEVLAANIRREMDARGWNQVRLAEECGWPPARITEILQGKFDPRLGTIEKVAVAFGVTAPALLLPPQGGTAS